MARALVIPKTITENAELQKGEKLAARERETHTAQPCPECGGDSKVTSSPKTHPEFIECRRRYHKCLKCGHNFVSCA
jgi:hypothetical protein